MPSISSPMKVVVTGDFTIDWYLARIRATEREGSLGDPLFETGAFRQPGGAVLLGKLIQQAARYLKIKPSVLTDDLPKQDSPMLGGYWHSFTILAEFLRDPKEDKQRMAWRVEEFLGFRKQPDSGGIKPEADMFQKSNDKGEASLVVIDFFGKQDFAGDQNLWPESLKQATPGWLLLRWSRPSFSQDQKFWTTLKEKFPDRITAVVTLNDLRLGDMQISRGLSWERTAQDVVREIVKRNRFEGCAHVIVSLETEGAVVLSRREGGGWESRLYYDPKNIESAWAEDYAGRMFGHAHCLMAGLALQMMHDPEFSKDLSSGVRSGLSAARKLHKDGFTAIWKEKRRDLERLEFPINDIASHLIVQQVALQGPSKKNVVADLAEKLPAQRVESPFLDEEIPDNSVKEVRKYWTISGTRIRTANQRERITREIIAEGYETLESKMPIAKFQDLFTVDRKEIESLRSIGALIREYSESKAVNRPLSLAIFGSPGSGKSFAITSVARALTLGGSITTKEFNLSQFGGPEDLFGALHQVRDAALSGTIPLVFWDEFDTNFGRQPLGWLRYFLAPMQDAKFQEGQVTHFIGRAIFVFAGGTYETMEDFKGKTIKNKNAKGPDFLSRLKGYVNVPILDHPNNNGVCEPDFHIEIRRAILLRSLLRRFAPDLVDKSKGTEHIGIHTGVRHAFLRIPQFNFGARSMESIIQMSLLNGKSHFELSSLPPEEQLSLHVESTKFLELARREDRADSE